jgi:hypothetical protein
VNPERVRRRACAERATSLVACLGFLGGCATVLGIEDTELAQGGAAGEPSANGQAGAGGADARWACRGNNDGRSEPGPNVSVPLSILNFETGSPPSDLRVVACRAPGCNPPVWGPVGPGEDGRAVLVLPPDFKGFLEITSSSTLPTHVQLTRTVSKMGDVPEIELLTRATLGYIAARSGVELEPDAALALFRAIDCSGIPAADVHFTLRELPEARAFYLENSQPTFEDVGTGDEGGGGFINLPPGFATVRVTLGSGAGAVSLGEFGMALRSGWVTYASVEPE